MTKSEGVLTKTRKIHRLISAGLTALLACAIGMVSAGPANATLTNNICEFAVFIGVRGTNATPGYAPVASHGNRIWWQGGMGGISNLPYALQNNSPMPFYIASLNYPASDGAAYGSSVTTGRNTLVTELNWLVEQCGSYLPAVVLAGHSQGAAVVLNALVDRSGQTNLTAKAKASIRAVATFGDPNYRTGQATSPAGSATSGQGLFGARTPGESDQLAGYRFWGWPQGGSGQGWVYKVRNLCYTNDVICTQSGNMDVHNSYNSNSNTIQTAKGWIEYMLTQ